MSFSDTTVIEGGRERKRSWDLSLLFWKTRYSNNLTPLPRTGMFSKIWRAILVEVAGPEAPHSMIPKNQHFPRTSLTVIAPPSIHFAIQLVEYTFKPPPLTFLKPYLIFIKKHSRHTREKYSKPNKQLFILSKCQPSLTGLQGTLPDSVSVVYFNADLRPFRENRNRAPCHTWQLKLIYFWELQLAYSRGSFQ